MDRGGAETLIMNTYRNIDRTKIQFDFIVHTTEKCAYDDEIISFGGKIFNIPRYNIKNHIEYKKEWNNFFRKHRHYKIIYGHMTSTAVIYLKIARKYGLVTISHIHSTSSLGKGFTAIIKSNIERRAKKIADYLFACSMAAGKWCYGNDVLNKVNFHIIPNAIDIEMFTFNSLKRELKRKEFDIEDKFVVGHVGSFTTPKNHTFIIEIFKNIYDKNDNAVLLLVGDGEFYNDINEKIKLLGLKEVVIFTGSRPDISDLMCAMDVFLFPSLHEGLGIVLIEAQTNGLYCVASDVVPLEAKATNLLEYISLNESSSYWADAVLKYNGGYERENMQEKVNEAGYNIKNASKWFEEFYINL
jgi:glycosyltransferase involved in cell wall biosynthesis